VPDGYIRHALCVPCEHHLGIYRPG
jgi:hypothetical protein